MGGPGEDWARSRNTAIVVQHRREPQRNFEGQH